MTEENQPTRACLHCGIPIVKVAEGSGGWRRPNEMRTITFLPEGWT